MAGPITSTQSYLSQSKDGFGWGLKSFSYPLTLGKYNEAVVPDLMFAYDSFTTTLVGRKHTRYKTSNPPQSVDRMRAYMSFFTSGFQNLGHIESVVLRMYVQRGEAWIGPSTATPTYFAPYLSDWDLGIFTISGGEGAVQRTYEAGYNPATYGFGDSIKHYDAGLDDYILNYDSWGEYSDGTSNSTLEQIVASGSFSSFSAQDGIIGSTLSNDGDIITFRGWIEIPIPISYVNNLGETHFKLGHLGEINNALPTEGDGTWNNYEYLTVETSESSNDPRLIVTYVEPADFVIGDLRLTDLSVQRHIQNNLDLDITFSGVDVLDGFPHSPETEFIEARNVSLEHVSSKTSPLEVGSRKSQDNRRFFVDIVCDSRGEMLDLNEKIKSILSESIDMYDFRYGFVNPPSVGRIHFNNLREFQVPPLPGPDRNRYHAVLSVDTLFARSG